MKITPQSKKIYQDASIVLSLINKTWKTADKESVSLIICESVKECMSNFLKCYLLMKSGEAGVSKNIGGLIKECAALNDRFKEIDLRWINCKEKDLENAGMVFCNSTEHTRICTWIANGIKEVLDEEINKTSPEVLANLQEN